MRGTWWGHRRLLETVAHLDNIGYLAERDDGGRLLAQIVAASLEYLTESLLQNKGTTARSAELWGDCIAIVDEARSEGLI